MSDENDNTKPDEHVLTLVHRDMAQRAFSLWLDDDGNVVPPPQDNKLAEDTAIVLHFKKGQPQAVPGAIFDYLIQQTYRIFDAPGDVELPIFMEGEPPPQTFDELPIDEQVAHMHGELKAMEQRMDRATDAVVRVAQTSRVGASPDFAELAERQAVLEHNMGRMATAIEDLAKSLKTRKRAAPKRRRARKEPAVQEDSDAAGSAT